MANSTEPGEVETVPTEEVTSASSCINEEKTSPIDETGGGGGEPEDESMEKVEFKVIFNKKKHDVTFPLDNDVGALKSHLQPLIGIPPAMMKVMIKGLARDEMTLRKLGVSKGSKVMVVGSSINDVLQMSSAPKDTAGAKGSGASGKEESSVTKIKQHKKILDRGKPDDLMPGRKAGKDSLPVQPLSGMLNKHGGKVRLTFKMDLSQVWIGTKERTEKVPFSSIKSVVSEPIPDHEEYHILALQLGPTEASRYYIYWLPGELFFDIHNQTSKKKKKFGNGVKILTIFVFYFSAQYIDAIKDAVLGRWQLF